MKRYAHIWWVMTLNATQNNFTSRFGALFLIIGKIIRFLFFLFFLQIIGTKTRLIASYTLSQMIFFYLTFQILDTLPQLFMRMVYRFRGEIVSGDFDYYLTKPFPPLFRALFGWTDALDIPMLIIAVVFLLIASFHVGTISFFSVFLYIALLINSFVIALAFHVMILSLGVLTTEIDNATMFYRDLTQMGRVPVDIYHQPLRGIITFAIPVGIMMTIPVKALMGLLTLPVILVSFSMAALLLTISMVLWRYALKSYASASS